MTVSQPRRIVPPWGWCLSAQMDATAGLNPRRAWTSRRAAVGRYALPVTQPEIQRHVRQQRGDIDALYEIVERVDQKVDALDGKVDRRFDDISGQLTEVLRQLRDR